MPRVLDFPKALENRIRQKEQRIEALKAEINTFREAQAVFKKSSPPRRRRKTQSA